ncbi:MAG TPA: AGE family epimerase/isomerase [Candidatus Competibacteraceae bacterium]|nr:AGE family epimerase/isomerase [Candidatus Competibacteraceae bacterium]
MRSLPDFRSPEFLREHGRSILAFYLPRCRDPRGGFYHYYRDDGSVYDAERRHLVSSTRFVVNFAWAAQLYGATGYLDLVRHGLAFLESHHYDREAGGYRWEISRDGALLDAQFYAYGHAFVLLAHASALAAGVEEARQGLERSWEILEQRFWSPQHGLYADIADCEWRLDPYRGQNANMHACEALLAAYEASGEQRYLERAATLAHNITVRQTATTDGLVWEHYDSDWNVDWEFHKDQPDDLFRPWGFQPGHQVEWAKLLLILERHRPAEWLLPRARELFERAVERGWDGRYDGLVYGFAPDGAFCSADKYFWVQAEALAAAALLARRSGEERYWQWYDRLWAYSWEHLVDHRFGAWFRILSRDNRQYSNEKSPAGKVDYHTFGACVEVLKALGG